MTIYIFLFLLFSFLGWIIDSTYSSIVRKEFVSSGYYKNLPLCPIYGFGGIIIYQAFSGFSGNSPVVVILLTTFFAILLEYIGGAFCEKVLNEKLWDYSQMKYNLHGYISLLHSFYWLLLITFLYFLLNPHLEAIESFLSIIREKTILYDLYISIGFVFFTFILTMKTKDSRLKELNKLKKRFISR